MLLNDPATRWVNPFYFPVTPIHQGILKGSVLRFDIGENEALRIDSSGNAIGTMIRRRS